MTRMIAFDITKLTTEKFRQCTVHIKKCITVVVLCFGEHRSIAIGSTEYTHNDTNLPHENRWA